MCVRYIVASIFFRQSYLILCVQNKTYNFKEEICMYRCIHFVYTYTVRTHVSRRIKGGTNIENRPLLLSRVSYFYAFRYIQSFFPSNLCESVRRKRKKVQNELYKVFFLTLFFSFSSSFLSLFSILRHLVFREDRYRRNL